MEDESVTLIKYVPHFARGSNILLLHDDALSLVYLSTLLEQYSFKVTTTDDTTAAVSMICDHEGSFKLIMAKSNMPGMDALSFLDVVHGKDILVIFISSGGFDDATWRTLAKGSCYFIEEPIYSNDLKYLWQLVYHSKVFSAQETQNADCQKKVCSAKVSQHIKSTQPHNARLMEQMKKETIMIEGANTEKRTVDNQAMPATQCHIHKVNGKRNHDDNGGMLKEKSTIDNLKMPGSGSSAQLNVDNNYDDDDDVFSEKRRVWTHELYQKFTEAVHALGENDARPKAILKRMNEPYLTVRQVASHLQKYKARLKQMENASKSDLPLASTSSCSSGTGQVPSPSEEGSSLLGTEGHESQNQDQFLMNDAETQDLQSDIFLPLETQENPTLPLDLTSQSLDSTVGHYVPAALVNQDQPATEYDDLMKMLADDTDNFDWFGNGNNPHEVDQYRHTKDPSSWRQLRSSRV